MNEHTFSAKIIKKCREKGIEKAWKINDNFAGGVPDAWFLGNKNDLWIEFKWLNSLPKRESTMIKPALTPQQFSWLKALRKCNRKIWVVLGYPEGCFILHNPQHWEDGVSLELGMEIDGHHWQCTHNELVDFLINVCTKEE